MSDETKTETEYKAKRFRSPPYPSITLSKAIERAEELYESAQHHAVPPHVLASAWNYTTKSSAINSTVAALKQYGLLHDEGSGGMRRFKVSNDAIRIVTDPIPNSPKRVEAIKRAMLAPKIHGELWDRYGLAGLSGSMDATLESYLTLDRKDAGEAPYSRQAAQEIVEVYKDSISYAGLGDSDIIPDLDQNMTGKENQNKGSPSDERKFGSAKIGDLIQWESNGALKFEKPLRVRAVQPHDGEEWVFVDGSETGIRMNEVIVEKEGPTASFPMPPVFPLGAEHEDKFAVGMRREVIALDEGDVILTFPKDLSAHSYDDLEGYLKLFLKKARRRAGISDQSDKDKHYKPTE